MPSPSHLLLRTGLVGLASLAVTQTAEAAPMSPVRGGYTWLEDVNAGKTPAINKDFPDPAILEGPDQWYAFATAGNGKHIQYATAPEPTGPWTYVDEDLLPDPGSWTDNVNVWAPDVRMVDDGTYVMYYAAALANNTAVHCVGVATADDITGPWTVDDVPWQCDSNDGGTIDASGFVDDDGTRYVTYKIDGNNLGNGGSCTNTVEPIHTTPIMLQQVAGDGVTKVGKAVQILDRTAADGPLVEAPNLVRSSSGQYVLFYSSHCFTSVDYNVLYATADDVRGPYTRGNMAVLMTGMFNLTSPGGGTSTVSDEVDPPVMLFHANCEAGGSNRCMFVSTYTETGASVLAN